jgi:hypothetical protein
MDSEWSDIPRPGDVADYADAIACLHRLDVPTKLVARLFQTSSPNIRKVRSRGTIEPTFLPTPRITPLLKQYGSDEKHWAKMREMSEASHQARSDSRIEDLEKDLAAIVEHCIDHGKFAEAADTLQRFRMYASNATNPLALRMQSIVHFFIAMAETNSGDSQQSSASAKRAMLTALKGFDDWFGDKEFLNLYMIAALPAVNAAVSLRAVKEAFEVLNELEAATLYSAGRLTSHHMCLKGRLLVKDRRYPAALECFNEARRLARQYREFDDELMTRWAIDRAPNVLESKVDDAFQLASDTALHFGDGTFQHWIAISSAAGAAFTTDNHAATREAIELLAAMQKSPYLDLNAKRNHFLLSITPQLELDLSKRTEWIHNLL